MQPRDQTSLEKESFFIKRWISSDIPHVIVELAYLMHFRIAHLKNRFGGHVVHSTNLNMHMRLDEIL
jgi:hypothetical protein